MGIVWDRSAQCRYSFELQALSGVIKSLLVRRCIFGGNSGTRRGRQACYKQKMGTALLRNHLVPGSPKRRCARGVYWLGVP